jgi:CRP-like cAMP-binding protein
LFPSRLARNKLLRLGAFDRVEVEEGRSIARQGEPANWVYVVLSGRVDEVSVSRSCRRCGPGDVVGASRICTRTRHQRHAVIEPTTRRN